MTAVAMPRLSDSMEEGTILKWLVETGTVVSRGQEIAEIETDKATMTFEADEDGPLTIVASEGDTLAVGAVIAVIGEGADGAGAGGPAGPADGSPERRSASGSAPERSVEPPASAAGTSVAGAAGPSAALAEPSAAGAAGTGAAGAPAPGASPPASPVARRVAQELGVDLSSLSGTGPRGRIVRADVEAAGSGAAGTAAPAVAAPAGADAPAGKGSVEVVELSRVQQLIARRMAEAKATIPEFTVTIDVDAEAAFALRDELRGVVDPLPSINDLVVKAAATALREHPRANGSYRDGAFELHDRVNVGIAVAGPDTLVVPTIFDADAKTLTRIAADARALAARVREGTVTPPELSGGTFSVSNLGMYGVTSFQAVINPPQAAILAVGAAVARPVPGPDGTLVARRVMQLTLTADHRILYGADAAAFLATVRDCLEQPLRMLAR